MPESLQNKEDAYSLNRSQRHCYLNT